MDLWPHRGLRTPLLAPYSASCRQDACHLPTGPVELKSLSMLPTSVELPLHKAVATVVALVLLPIALQVSWSSTFMATESKKSRQIDAASSRKEMTSSQPKVPVLYSTLDLLAAPHNLHDRITRACRNYRGRPFTLKTFGLPDILVIATPQAFEDVLKTQFANFPKGPRAKEIMHDLLGDGIITMDGKSWAQQRSLVRRSFQRRELRDSMIAAITRHTIVLHDVLKRACAKNQTVDLCQLFNRFAMQAFADISCGMQLNCLESSQVPPFQTAFVRAQHLISQRFVRPRWFWKMQQWMGIGAEEQLRRDIRFIDAAMLSAVQDVLVEHASAPEDTASDKSSSMLSFFLDSIANSHPSNEELFDQVYLRDIAVNFLVAGRNNTAQALSWFFYNIIEHPHVETKLRREIYTKLPEFMTADCCVPTLTQVNKLVYLEAAIKETLRLYPSVPISLRQSAHDTVLSDGTFVAANSMVCLPMYAMGRLPHVWGADAAEFKPERWIDPITGKITSVSAFRFVAFNAGPRMCPGTALAGLELKLVAAALLSRFHMNVDRPEDVAYAFSTTLPMKGDMNVTLARV